MNGAIKLTPKYSDTGSSVDTTNAGYFRTTITTIARLSASH